MMKITLLCLGKLKESYWEETEAEYLKRLRPYAKVNIVELKEEPFSERSNVEHIKKIEAEHILARVPEDALLIALDEQGASLDSPAFATFLQKNTTRGEHLVFVIGGPRGLHDTVFARAAHRIALSRLTFPHQMVRTIVLEQLYRACTILHGKSYHY